MITNFTNYNLIEPKNIEINQFNKLVCDQIHGYLVYTGIIVCLIYVMGNIFINWYFTKGYKGYVYRPETATGKIIGNLHDKETRYYWTEWIKNKLSKLLLGYSIAVIYLNW